MHFSDPTIVERSELIVVGHLKDNSIQYVPLSPPTAEGQKAAADFISGKFSTNDFLMPLSDMFGKGWEHHAILVISGIIKGKCTNAEIPVIIHYGLEPIVGGYATHDGVPGPARGGGNDFPATPVMIIVYPATQVGGPAVTEDASKDNLWFLRRLGGHSGWELTTTGDFGIYHEQDIQPLKLKEYFELYLTKDPTTALKAYAAEHPEVAYRAQRGLENRHTGQ